MVMLAGVIYCCVLHDFTMLKPTTDFEFLSSTTASDDGNGNGNGNGEHQWDISVQFWSLPASRESLVRSACTFSLSLAS